MRSSKLILVGWSFFSHCVYFSVLFVVLGLNSGPRSWEAIAPPLSYVLRSRTESMLFLFFMGTIKGLQILTKRVRDLHFLNLLSPFLLVSCSLGSAWWCVPWIPSHGSRGRVDQHKRTTERQGVRSQSNPETLAWFSFQVRGQKIQNDVHSPETI